MTSNLNTEKRKIKRRNFFWFLGASVAGLVSLKNIPFRILKEKTKLQNKITVSENPGSVKRNSLNRDTMNAKGKFNG
jgi:hypothetical protein